MQCRRSREEKNIRSHARGQQSLLVFRRHREGDPCYDADEVAPADRLEAQERKRQQGRRQNAVSALDTVVDKRVLHPHLDGILYSGNIISYSR